jgi:hypothetical protein
VNTSYHTPVAFATNVSERETPPNSAAPILSNAPIQVASTKRAYTGIADYFAPYGLTAADYQPWQWQQVKEVVLEHRTIYRPAFKLETANGPRWRFSDAKGGYIHNLGYKPCLYGLSDKVIASADDETPLVLCNGERSTVVAQKYLLLAFCITSGEKRIPDNLLDELKRKLAPGIDILVTLDCDPAGRRATAVIVDQLNAAGFQARGVDLGLSDGGDLADFCVLPGASAYERLKACAPLEIPESDKPAFIPRIATARPVKPANISADAEARADLRRAAWFKKAWDGIIRTLETTSSGRNAALFSAACKLFDLVHSYPQYSSESAAYDALYQASATNGYLAKDGQFAVNGAIKSAQRTPRQYTDMPFDPYDNPAPRRQYSACAEDSNYSPIGETAAPAALPDAIIQHGLDETYGLSIMSEITLLLDAMARGQLPAVHFQEDRNAIPGAPPVNKNLYTEMADLGILKRVSPELFLDLTHIDSSTWAKTRNNTAGRKKTAYQLVSIEELKRLMVKPMMRSLMLESMQSDEMPLLDETLISLVRHVLGELLTWHTLKVVHIGTVRYCLKKTDKHRAAEVLETIKALQITDPALITVMDLKAAAPAAAAFMQQVDSEIASLIDLKNQLMARLYKAHLKALDNPTITPLPENAPRHGKAWRNAYYNALIKPYHEGYLWPDELSAAMGIEDKNTTKRHAAAAGIIIGETRFEVRAFTVESHDDYKPSWDEVKRAAYAAAKHEDKALDGRVRVYGPKHLHSVIRSYDAAGRLIGKGYASDDDDPDDWRIGGTHFTVELDLRPLITVMDAAPMADANESDASDSDAMPETAAAIDIEGLDDEALRQIAAFIAFVRELHRASRRREAKEESPNSHRRMTPARLHDDVFMLRRLMASYCLIGKHGMWCHPLNAEELFETHAAALDDLMRISEPSELQAVS